jgi:predicted transcriptional regulator
VVARVSAPKPGRRAASKRVRRSSTQLESVAASIFAYVEKNPGKRAEDIKAALKLKTSDWALPVKKLLEEGRVSAKGEKRATTYAAKAGARAK